MRERRLHDVRIVRRPPSQTKGSSCWRALFAARSNRQEHDSCHRYAKERRHELRHCRHLLTSRTAYDVPDQSVPNPLPIIETIAGVPQGCSAGALNKSDLPPARARTSARRRLGRAHRCCFIQVCADTASARNAPASHLDDWRESSRTSRRTPARRLQLRVGVRRVGRARLFDDLVRTQQH